MPNQIVGIVYSDDFRRTCCLSPKFGDRFALVMDLINAYQLIPHLHRIPPLQWNSPDHAYKDLVTFHSMEYVDALRKLQSIYLKNRENDLTSEEEAYFDSFQLVYDCPGFVGVLDYALSAVQGSLAAVDALIHHHCRVAINWGGGWHHAKRDEASGFCYLNDIVLAINRLLSSTADGTTRVLYLDFDLHHGDGVESAFWYSPRVVTFSVHHASPGFFPGTGTWISTDGPKEKWLFPDGAGHGRHSAFNLPLDEGIDDVDWSNAVLPVLDLLHCAVQPTYVVVQSGADCLTTDPHRIFHLTNSCSVSEHKDTPTPSGYLHAMQKVLSWQLPTLILGGGGYNFEDTARLWTRITALAIEKTQNIKLNLPTEIPEHSFFSRYGPDFDLNISSPLCCKSKPVSNFKIHHSRLLNQACNYARLNNITVDTQILPNVFI